jgi:hypothetical protein|tara:strand:+ start:250 stop:549 length:300 start_codon:yes stop_codon:yes gene_type:complete
MDAITEGGVKYGQAVARKFRDDVEETLVALWYRWQDERGYEDLTDYIEPLRGFAQDHRITLLSGMVEIPAFGFTFNAGGPQNHFIGIVNGEIFMRWTKS